MNKIQIENQSTDIRKVEFGVYAQGVNLRIFDDHNDPTGAFLTLAGCVALRDALTDYIGDESFGDDEPIPYALTGNATVGKVTVDVELNVTAIHMAGAQ